MSKEDLLGAAELSGLPDRGLAVVGFSGGADSTALAHWLKRKIGPVRIVLAHVNHMLRGEEAERDEAAARRFAREMGLRFVVSRVDVREKAQRYGMGLEECGRQVRYDFFLSLAAGEEDRILTAHNANDNAETMLLNLCRGTGLAGLCGIPPQRGKILRPLLKVGREEIEAYCRAYGLSYVQDSSNRSPEFARNRVRMEVLPVLRELNPRVVETMTQTAGLLRRDREYLSQEEKALLEKVRRPYGLDVSGLLGAPGALRDGALKRWLAEKGCGMLERKHFSAVEACLRDGGAVALPGGVTVRSAQGILSVVEQGGEPFSFSVYLPAKGLGGGKKVGLPGGRTLVLEEKQAAFQKIHNLDFKNAMDYDIITGTLRVRNRQPGDRFSPAGRGVSKSLKQIFQECGMPAEQRKTAVLLEWEGRLAWCQGAGAAEGFQVTEKTRRLLWVTVENSGDRDG